MLGLRRIGQVVVVLTSLGALGGLTGCISVSKRAIANGAALSPSTPYQILYGDHSFHTMDATFKSANALLLKVK